MTLIHIILLLTVIEGSRTFGDILLSNLDQKAGITINSLTPSDFLGYSVSKAGDFNDDGYDDVIIGSHGAKNPNGARTGAIYIIFGSKNGLSDSTVPFGLGLIIYRANQGDRFGYSVSYTGDVNDDGIDDVIIGGDQYQLGKGIAYIIYGSKTLPAIIDLSQGLDASQGFTITGSNTDDFLGGSVSWAGDVNNDQIDDIVVGGKGAAYVIFGKKGTRGNVVPGSELSSAEGFAIFETALDSFGIHVSNAGDMDGDGIDDIAVGSYGKDAYAGAVYIIFGKDGSSSTFTTIDFSQGLSPSDGFTVKGSSPMSQLGMALGFAGDFNDDGFSDVIVGAPGDYTFDGAVYVLFGNDRSALLDIDLSSGFDPARAVRVRGAGSMSCLGVSVNGIGDLNGDGIDDLLMGAPLENSSMGIAYVIFGSKNPVPEILLSAGLDPVKGFRVVEAGPNGNLGAALSSAGDVNGDGTNDLIIGSYGVDTSAGAAYILFTPGFCPEECLTCSTSSICLTCREGYGLENSQCIICPATTKLENGICIALPPKSPLQTTTEVSKGLFDSGSAASRIFTMGRSLSVGLGLIAKIIQNVRFLNISYPAETLNAFKSYGTDLFELPIPDILYETPETKGLPSQYSRYDISPAFLENYWQTIMMILMTLGGYFVIRVVQYLTQSQNKKNMLQIILKNVGQTAANFLIIQVYSSLDDVIFFFLLDVGSTRMSSASAGISMGAAGFFVLLGGLFVFLHCWVLGKYQQAKRQDQLEIFQEKFRIVGTLFEDFKDDSATKQSFFGILILRCVFLVLVIMLLQPPWIQASLLMLANLIFLAYLIYQRPFKSRFDEFSQYFSELNVFVAYLSVLILSILDYKDKEAPSLRDGLGKCIVIAGIVLCLGGFIIQMIQIMIAIYGIFKFFKNYEKKVQVSPESPEASNGMNQISIESSSILRNINKIELTNISHRNKVEKLQCSSNESEISFANNDDLPILTKTSKRGIEDRNSEVLRTQESQLVLNLGSENPHQIHVNRRNKKLKKRTKSSNLSIFNDHVNE